MRFSISVEIARSARPVLPNPKVVRDGEVKPRPPVAYPKRPGPIERKAMKIVPTPVKKRRIRKIAVRKG